jgi:hypothetical protein
VTEQPHLVIENAIYLPVAIGNGVAWDDHPPQIVNFASPPKLPTIQTATPKVLILHAKGQTEITTRHWPVNWPGSPEIASKSTVESRARPIDYHMQMLPGASYGDDLGTGGVGIGIETRLAEALSGFIEKAVRCWASATDFRYWSRQACYPARSHRVR